MESLRNFGGMIMQGLMSGLSFLLAPVVNVFKSIFGVIGKAIGGIAGFFSPPAAAGQDAQAGDSAPQPQATPGAAPGMSAAAQGPNLATMILSGLFGLVAAPAAQPPPAAPEAQTAPAETQQAPPAETQQAPPPKAPPEEAPKADKPQAAAPASASEVFNVGADAKTGGTEIKVGDGKTTVYIPKDFKPNADGTYNVIYHFHGVPQRQRENIEESGVNAVVVSYNMEGLSGVYKDKFAHKPQMFTALMERTQKAVEKSGKAPGAKKIGRIALSGWSAGFGAVGSILAQPGMEDRIDSIFIADGLHTALKDGKPYGGSVQKWSDFARRAMAGEKTFVVTHSSIPTQGYASTTQTAEVLLEQTGVARHDVSGTGPRGMKKIYEADKGNFHVKGFGGTGKSDHIDHIMAMDSLHYSYLADSWGTVRPSATLKTDAAPAKPRAAAELAM